MAALHVSSVHGHTALDAVTMCVCVCQRDFIMQTGDPSGTGRGGESIYRSVVCFLTPPPPKHTHTPQLLHGVLSFSKLYGDQARFFDTEKVPRIKHRKKGTVSMVNNGNDQHGSQVTL